MPCKIKIEEDLREKISVDLADTSVGTRNAVREFSRKLSEKYGLKGAFTPWNYTDTVYKVRITEKNIEALVEKQYIKEYMIENSLIKKFEEKFAAENEIKPGVSELFESNPELANAVYEALGFGQEDDFKQTFINSLWRGQESQPFIDENGNLVLAPTYDSLFKSEGVSFAENLNMAQEYGERYSKNPFIIEIDESYADSIYPLDRKGRSKDYGKRVVGDEREQRFVTKDNIVIPKGKFKIHKKTLNLNLSDVKTSVLLKKYQEQFTEGDVAENLRYGEIAKGYATEDPLVFKQVEQELLKRGITKKDLPFLIQNPLNGLKYNVAEALSITKEFTDNFTGKKFNLPEESFVTQKDIDFYLNKVEEVKNKLENKGTKNEISSENGFQPTPQQKQEAQQKFQEYVNTTGKQDIEGFKEFVSKGQPRPTKEENIADPVTGQLSFTDHSFHNGKELTKDGKSIDQVQSQLYTEKFEEYFPDYSYYTKEDREFFIEELLGGKIEITCKI